MFILFPRLDISTRPSSVESSWLCSWRRYLPEKCPESDILVHSPFNIFRVASPTPPFCSRLLCSGTLALYISYMSGVARTRVLCFSGNFAMRARLRCTRARLSFASRKHRGYYACMPGFDVAEGWGIFFFTWIPRGTGPGVLEYGASRIFL